MLVSILLSVFLVIGLFLTKKHFRQLQLSAKLKGPPGLPLLGNGLELVNKSPIGNFKFHELSETLNRQLS